MGLLNIWHFIDTLVYIEGFCRNVTHAKSLEVISMTGSWVLALMFCGYTDNLQLLFRALQTVIMSSITFVVNGL